MGCVMKLPCEIVIWYLLPAIRAALARELANLGLSQRDISEKLGVSEAAVSQYIKGKRGKKIDLTAEVYEIVRETAKSISLGTSIMDVYRKTCSICLELRRKSLMCNLHKTLDTVPESCDLCPCLLDTSR
ncbi:MAG: helix-turn-helix domain-containing protein [Candidatus Jordarchaeales archaeon]